MATRHLYGYHSLTLSDPIGSGYTAFFLEIQGGSIKPLLRFGGSFFHIGMRFEKNLNKIVICVTLSVYCENVITNRACVARISIFA